MARVCQKWFPKGTFFKQKDSGFYMDNILKQQIDVLIKNIKRDWDFTIIVTGSGEVRVGKSVLAMQIAAYWAYEIQEQYGIKVPFSVEENFVLEGKRLIEVGNKLGQKHPYSPLIFDEAGADLEGRKVMQTSTQEVLDFFRECGQYNLLNILVLPEYFDLPKGIALSRSICLINVYYTTNEEGIFERGFFNFYSRRNKKYLYLNGKKQLDYNAYKYNFHGRFFDNYPIDEKDYRKLKQEALSQRERGKRSKFHLQRDAAWYMLNKKFGIAQEDIAKFMKEMTKDTCGQSTIADGIAYYKEVLENSHTPITVNRASIK